MLRCVLTTLSELYWLNERTLPMLIFIYPAKFKPPIPTLYQRVDRDQLNLSSDQEHKHLNQVKLGRSHRAGRSPEHCFFFRLLNTLRHIRNVGSVARSQLCHNSWCKSEFSLDHCWSNVDTKRIAHPSESRTPPTLSTSLSVQLNHIQR